MKFLTNKLDYIIFGFAGLILGLGAFNIIDGTFLEKNSWQSTCGLFQVLYASSLILFAPRNHKAQDNS